MWKRPPSGYIQFYFSNYATPEVGRRNKLEMSFFVELYRGKLQISKNLCLNIIGLKRFTRLDYYGKKKPKAWDHVEKILKNCFSPTLFD